MKAQTGLIIGATSAIAAESARFFVEKGFHLALVGRSENKLDALVQDLVVRKSRDDQKIIYKHLDLMNFSLHADFMSWVETEIGSLDFVYVAHGSLSDQVHGEQDYQYFENEFKLNFLSVVSILTPIANAFEQRKSGTIAVITSVAGDRGRKSNYIYGSAKGALNLYLQGLRNRLFASKVAVVTIKPGFTDTPMTQGFEKKGPLWSSARTVGWGAARAILSKKDEVYLPYFWKWILFVICMIPERIFKKLKL